MAAITHNDIGDIWRPQATFTVNGVNTDPTTLVTRLMKPDGTITTASYSVASLTTVSSPVAKSTTGTFVYSVSLDSAGHWYARFEGTGAAVAAEDFETIVDPSPFYSSGGLSSRALVTLGEAKDYLKGHLIDTTDDLRIVRSINSISKHIHEIAGREFKPKVANPSTRQVRLFGSGYYAEVGDLMTVSTASTTISISQLDPALSLHTFTGSEYLGYPNPPDPDEPVTSIYFMSPVRGYWRSSNVLNITGYWGFPTVPEDIKMAALQGIAYELDVDTEHFRQDLAAVPGGSEGGQTVFVGQGMPTVFPLPPEAFRKVIQYRKRLVTS